MPSAAGPRNAITRAVLTMRCTVWSRTSGSGPYNNAIKTWLACRLDNVNVQPQATTSERAEAAANKTLLFDPTYAMPASGVQIEVTSPIYYAGQRWNLVAGTAKAEIPPGFDGPIAVSVDLRRAS